MKLIDEKGRIFGKINVIDFLVILFLLCILPAFYFGYKIMTKKPMELPKKEFVVIEANYRLIKLRPELLKAISVGDKELDEQGELIGEIVSLDEAMPYKYEIDIGQGQRIIKEDPILKQTEAKVKLKAEVKQDKLYYKDKVIRIGSPLEFKTNKYSLVATPLKEEEGGIVTLEVKFKNLIPELFKIIEAGDKEIEVDKDNRKKIVTKIIKIVSNESAEVISLMDNSKKWSIVGHPKYRDLVLEIKAVCVRRPNGLFLKNKPLKIGSNFEFSTDLYSISGTIIGIKEK